MLNVNIGAVVFIFLKIDVQIDRDVHMSFGGNGHSFLTSSIWKLQVVIVLQSLEDQRALS